MLPTLPSGVDVDPRNSADGQTIGTVAGSCSGTLFGWTVTLRTRSASFGPYLVADAQLPCRVTLAASPHCRRPPGQVRTVTSVSVPEASTQRVTPCLLTRSPTFVFLRDVSAAPPVRIDGLAGTGRRSRAARAGTRSSTR